jgi:death on curing protein
VNWRWVSLRAVLALHTEQIAEHGGLAGVRDRGMLESALARPQQLAAYEPEAPAARLAAAYAYGIARNHPFADGNKRAAFVVAATFLALNGHDFRASEREVVETILRLAAGDLTEPALADWFAIHSAERATDAPE